MDTNYARSGYGENFSYTTLDIISHWENISVFRYKEAICTLKSLNFRKYKGYHNIVNLL